MRRLMAVALLCVACHYTTPVTAYDEDPHHYPPPGERLDGPNGCELHWFSQPCSIEAWPGYSVGRVGARCAAYGEYGGTQLGLYITAPGRDTVVLCDEPAVGTEFDGSVVYWSCGWFGAAADTTTRWELLTTNWYEGDGLWLNDLVLVVELIPSAALRPCATRHERTLAEVRQERIANGWTTMEGR